MTTVIHSLASHRAFSSMLYADYRNWCLETSVHEAPVSWLQIGCNLHHSQYYMCDPIWQVTLRSCAMEYFH